jgi:tRNA-(ms[2]io[6]A)-hydroxylase
VSILLVPTAPAWLDRVLADPDTLLLDTAHCEKRAASTVLSFIFRAPHLADTLSRLAREELTHFEACLRQLAARSQRFVPLEPPRYAADLARHVRRGDVGTLDLFVVAALIEARSGERLALLAGALPDGPLRTLYADLYPPEERHHVLLLELAATFGPVDERLADLAAVEALLVAAGDPRVRMHG